MMPRLPLARWKEFHRVGRGKGFTSPSEKGASTVRNQWARGLSAGLAMSLLWACGEPDRGSSVNAGDSEPTTTAETPTSTSEQPATTEPAASPNSSTRATTSAGATTTAPGPATTQPCEQPVRPPERAAPPDHRICLTFSLSSTSARRGDVVTGVLRAENRSNETVDLTRPESCPVWWGLYVDGEWMGGQGGEPMGCYPMVTEDEMKPGEVREHQLEFGTDNTSREERQKDRRYEAYAGLQTMNGVLYAAPLPLVVDS